MREAAPMDWKVSFFVRTATRTASGWVIHGEPGIGRPEPGDQLEALVRDEGREEPVDLLVESCSEDELRVTGSLDEAIGPGDILVGMATR
jgi:hypothetical protein